MGHACNSSGNNCSDSFSTPISDRKIEYTGPAVPALGICTGDWLSEVETVLLQKIADYATGKGISIPDIDLNTCDLFVNDLTCCETCTDLPCLMEAYLQGLCSLYGDLEAVKTQVTALLSGPYDTACLSGVTPASKLPAIIQSLINGYCALANRVSALETALSSLSGSIDTKIGSYLGSHMSTCTGTGSLIKSGSGATTSFAFKGFVPVGAIIPFGGTTVGRFDSTGLGIAGTDACGFALANGNNGTVNMTGLVPLGSTTMGTAIVTGGTTANPLTYNATGGTFTVLLTGAQSGSAAHTHTISDPAHDHAFFGRADRFKFGQDTPAIDAVPPSAPNGGPYNSLSPGNIGKNFTGITINPSGAVAASVAHENMMPYRALYYIQRIS